MIIAVDFDGTLCTNRYPLIGKPIWPVIEMCVHLRQQGHILILYTCREKKRLKEAVDWIEGLVSQTTPILRGRLFKYVNENTKERIKNFGGDSRKISADIYIDDKAVNNTKGYYMNFPLKFAELKKEIERVQNIRLE